MCILLLRDVEHSLVEVELMLTLRLGEDLAALFHELFAAVILFDAQIVGVFLQTRLIARQFHRIWQFD